MVLILAATVILMVALALIYRCNNCGSLRTKYTEKRTYDAAGRRITKRWTECKACNTVEHHSTVLPLRQRIY